MTRHRLAKAYLHARESLIEWGFAPEIDWQETRSLQTLVERDFLRESAWVILSAGMRESVIRRIFGGVSEAFLSWEDSRQIADCRGRCERRALKEFNHFRKIRAIGQVCCLVAQRGFEAIRTDIAADGVEFLKSLDYVGPITAYHLAKNIGLDVVKPDRHLVRAAAAAGYSHPTELCRAIASVTGDRLSVVDLVIWRYSALGHTIV